MRRSIRILFLSFGASIITLDSYAGRPRRAMERSSGSPRSSAGRGRKPRASKNLIDLCDAIEVNFGLSTHDLSNVPRRLAVKSNGAEKPKTHDLSDVTRRLAVMSIAEAKSEYEELALLVYR